MEENHLVKKLSLQTESFQAHFELLTKSKSFSEMIKNFENIICGTFPISDVHLFHKIKQDDEWILITQRGTKDPDLTWYFDNKVLFTIQFPDDKKVSTLVIIPLSDSSTLGIILGKKLDGTGFTVYDKIALQILTQVFDSAYKAYLNQSKVKGLLFELNEKILQLNNLIDTGIELSKCNSEETLCELGIMRAASLTNASSAMIEADNKTSGSVHEYIYPKSVEAHKIKENDLSIKSTFNFKDISFRFFLSEKETRKGFTSFNNLDKLLLDAISRQILASLENQDLHKQALAKEVFEKELQVAASIQKLIIPRTLPKIDGYDISGTNIPSKEVGGDYYDCIPLPDGKYAVIIADVAGKGIGAALLVNTLSAALHSYLEFDITPAELAFKLNILIYNSSTPDKFITFFFALLDPKTNEISVINAGHNPIFLLRKNMDLVKINAGGLGLGMLDFKIPYTGEILKMNEGDSLFLYTDGIPEAMNIAGEEYSDEKMIEFFLKNSALPAHEFIASIVDDVSKYVGTAEQSDDITAFFLKRSI